MIAPAAVERIDHTGDDCDINRAGVRVTRDRSAAAGVASPMSQVNLLPRLLPEWSAVPDAMGDNIALRPLVGIEDRAAATPSHPSLPLVPSLSSPARASVWRRGLRCPSEHGRWKAGST